MWHVLWSELRLFDGCLASRAMTTLIRWGGVLHPMRLAVTEKVGLGWAALTNCDCGHHQVIRSAVIFRRCAMCHNCGTIHVHA